MSNPADIRRARQVQTVLRVALLGLFAWLAGRFWHPYYGFTHFLLLDEMSASVMPAALRGAPIFTYPDGYDGHYYAQLAASPLLEDPALAQSVDSLVYRARRILLSWLAWLAGGGEPVAAVRAYAWLNLVLWSVLAATLWRLWPATGARETLAWTGVLFSAGVLHSVRLALPDLLALLLVTSAVMLAERGRNGWAAALLGAGGLARETSLLATAARAPTHCADLRSWVRSLAWAVAVALPFAAWLFLLASRLGWQEPGLGNFAWPLTGWWRKTLEVFQRLATEPDRWLALTTLLAHAGLTVQFLWLLARRRPGDAWWRVGAVFALLLLTLSTAVWEGHPGAATRVLLPMAVAFNVVALRSKASAWWLLAGNLPVASGVLALWHVPVIPREISSGSASGQVYLSELREGWHQIEHGRGRRWAWSAQGGEVEVRIWPHPGGAARLTLELRGITEREFTVAQNGVELARGVAGPRRAEVEVAGVQFSRGVARLRIATAAPPQKEAGADGGRELGLALSSVRLLDFQ